MTGGGQPVPRRVTLISCPAALTGAKAVRARTIPATPRKMLKTMSPSAVGAALKFGPEIGSSAAGYREHGFFTGRELYFLDPSENLLEVRDPTWKAGMATPLLAEIIGAGWPFSPALGTPKH